MMKYVVDRKKGVEKIYLMSLICETCIYEDYIFPPKRKCNTCPDYKKGCHTYKEASSGKIGMSFLEFISYDFDIIASELIELFYKVKNMTFRERLDALDDYLADKPFYFQMLDIHALFGSMDEFPEHSPEENINMLFNEVKMLRNIISAYADDRYFVEPHILLQAINSFDIMYIPSVNAPDYSYRQDDLKEDIIGVIMEFAEECKKIRSDTCESPNLFDSFGMALDWIISNDYRISRCENCGKFFVPYGRYDTKYCPYPFKNGKSCRELSYSINVENIAPLKEYRKIYKTKHAWMSRNSRQYPNAKKDFDKWHKAAKAMVDKYKLGAISENECLKWLNDNK